MLDIPGLQFRAALFQLIRSFFHHQGFLEVDTPIRQPVLLPESTITPIASGSWFLQASPEQSMKRILARGGKNIFQICPCFRAEERGAQHLEEFTMLEWYRSDADYHDLMTDCRSLLSYVLEGLNQREQYRAFVTRSCFGTMSAGIDWESITVSEAFSRWATIPLDDALESGRFDEVIAIDIEPHLGLQSPTFLYDYPAACASLARLKKDDARLAERFELYMDGMELANGFSELTDTAEQRARFMQELQLMETDNSFRKQLPERFLQDLDKIDRAAGIALGLDRLLMLLLSASSIDEVVSFSPDDWAEQGTTSK
ncbi:MAG: EF-P lysine aminoacylase EpmA [Desulfocapsaceae bacterium]